MASPPLVQRVEVLENRLRSVEQEIREFREETRTQFARLRDDLIARMDSGDEETRRHMRVLHEEVIGRIDLLQEGLGRSRRKKPQRT